MPEWLPALFLVSGLFGVLLGVGLGLAAGTRRENAVAIGVVLSAVAVIAAGVLMFQMTDMTREECGVVGTNNDDAEYVCVEVTE